MSKRRPPSSSWATSVSRSVSPSWERTGSESFASSPGKYIRVATRFRSPRASTPTARCGACSVPSGAGTRPGFSVTSSNQPSSEVPARPYPENPSSMGTFSRVSAGWAYRPATFACQISTSPSMTGSPAPSSRRPRILIARGSSSETSAEPIAPSRRPIERNGPAVCDGVRGGAESLIVRLLEGRRLLPADDDVEPVSECPVRLRQLHVESRDRPLPGVLRDGIENRVEREERVAGEVHLRDEPIGERTAEERKMDVIRAPGVRVVAPRVCARLDGDERVSAVVVRERAAATAEVRVERRAVLVDDVAVATGRVRLPDLDELAPERPTVRVEDATADDDPLSERLAL